MAGFVFGIFRAIDNLTISILICFLPQMTEGDRDSDERSEKSEKNEIFDHSSIFDVRDGHWLCCKKVSKIAKGCQSGTPRHHPSGLTSSSSSSTGDNTESWLCCGKPHGKKGSNEGCTEGRHPNPTPTNKRK